MMFFVQSAAGSHPWRKYSTCQYLGKYCRSDYTLQLPQQIKIALLRVGVLGHKLVFSTQYCAQVSDYIVQIMTLGSVGLRADQKSVLKTFLLFKNTNSSSVHL